MRALANTRVVDLGAAQRKDASSATSLGALYKTGAQLQVRACDVLTPRRFHENTPMGHFTPAHISKVYPPHHKREQRETREEGENESRREEKRRGEER